ncbi:MAG: type II toxin-antitoxin system HicA family toxin [Pyrinomonadaceae bacterium]
MAPSQIIKVLEKSGFFLARQSGSHLIYKNLEDRRATVPYHAGKVLHPKILRNIMKEADISIGKLRTLL